MSQAHANSASVLPEAQPRSARVAYIMGYGRSGSTLLDILLGSHPDVTSAGELAFYPEWRARDLSCACGEEIRACPFWSAVDARVDQPHPDHEPALALSIESRRQIRDLLSGNVPEEALADYKTLMENRFQAIADVSGRPVIVDSSKSAGKTLGRAYALQRHTDLDVRVLHLVRDGRGVLWSALKGPGSPERASAHKSRLMTALRVSLSWAETNRWTMKVAERLTPGTVLDVRYEELVSDPDGELSRIGEFLGLDPTPVIEKLRDQTPFASGHNVAGNRLRFQTGIKVRPDFEWRQKLSPRYQRIQALIAGRVSRQLGYPTQVERSPATATGTEGRIADTQPATDRRPDRRVG